MGGISSLVYRILAAQGGWDLYQFANERANAREGKMAGEGALVHFTSLHFLLDARRDSASFLCLTLLLLVSL